MYRCPVCQNESAVNPCAKCGFDQSINYYDYPTISRIRPCTVPISTLAERKKNRNQFAFACPDCGCAQFMILPKKGVVQCTACDREILFVQIIGAETVSDAEPVPIQGTFGSVISAVRGRSFLLQEDGTVLMRGADWNGDAVQEIMRRAKTCAYTGYPEPRQMESEVDPARFECWSGITAIAAGLFHVVGVKKDGTVVASGWNFDGQCDVAGWDRICEVSAGRNHTVALDTMGFVYAAGDNQYGQCDIDQWQNVTALSAGAFHTLGLQKDGKVVSSGLNTYDQCDTHGWSDIVSISSGYAHSVGLRRDGTVVSTRRNDHQVLKTTDWQNIIAVSAGDDYTAGLRGDGTVVVTGGQSDISREVASWTNIAGIYAGWDHIIGVCADGNLVAAGNNSFGQCHLNGLRVNRKL